MKFSVYNGNLEPDVCPLDGAALEPVLRVDRRYYKTPEEYDARRGKDLRWLEEGLDHRVTKDGIERDFPDTAWIIVLQSLSDLAQLARKVNGIEIGADDRGAKGLLTLQFNVDHRE